MKALTGKKFLSLLLSVLMCLSLMPLSAFADGETSKVAKIGDIEYDTLEAAIAAAKDGDTVTLLGDFEGNGIMIEKDRFPELGLTIDFAGYTYTVNSLVGSPSTLTQAAHFEQGNKITLEGGTLCVSDAASAKAKILVQNYADLTVDGMMLDGTNVQMSYQRLFTLSSNNGTVIINNSNITAPKGTYGKAIDICGFSSYKGTDVTVSGGSTISGTVCISADAAEGYALSLNLESGSIVGEFYMGENAGIAKITKSAEFVISGETPSGYKWEDNADGSSSLKKLDCEAKIVGTYYMTLEEAIDAAKAGATIKLLKDITRSEKLVVDKALTINLDGHTFTSTYAINDGDRYALVTNENVTIRNGSFVAENARAVCANANLTVSGATIKSGITGGHAVLGLSGEGCTYNITNSTIKGDYAVCGFAKNITVKITGSTLEGTGNVLYQNGTASGLKLTVNKTTINATGDGCGVYISGTDTAYEDVNVGAQKATFTNCTINSKTSGVEVKYTDLTLENCEVSVENVEASYTMNGNGPTTSGFAVVSTDNAKNNTTPAPKGSIVITGENGKYTGLVGLGSFAGVKETYSEFTDATYAISGGTFSSAVLPEYCADGFIPTKNDDGTYGVKSGSYVAEIVGGEKYESLEDAVRAANEGDTVNLLTNVTEYDERAALIGYDLSNKTLNLNGYTYTHYNFAHIFYGNNGIIKNGTIVSAAYPGNATDEANGYGSYALPIGWDAMSADNFTAENVTLIGGINAKNAKNVILKNLDVTGTAYYAIWLNEGATVSVDGGTYTAGAIAAVGAVADNNGQSVITVNSGTINANGKPLMLAYGGLLAVKGGVFENISSYVSGNGENPILISGGTFSSEVPADYCADGYKAVKNSDGTYEVIGLEIIRNLILSNNLTMNYRVKAGDYTVNRVVFSFYNDRLKVFEDRTVMAGTPDSNGYYRFEFTGINPQRMTDTLRAVVYLTKDGIEYSYDVGDYSVQEYCRQLLNSEFKDTWGELIGNLIEYGKQAQLYTKYHTDELVSDGVEYTATSYIDKDVTLYNKLTGDNSKVAIGLKKLVLSNEIAIRINFDLKDSVDLSQVKFNVQLINENDTVAKNIDVTEFVKVEGSTYYFDFSGLITRQLDNKIIFKAYVDGTEAETLEFNVNAYLKYFANDNDFGALATALFNYGYSCDNFQG